MDKQRENQLEQHKENLERQYEQQQRLAQVRVQDAYNKENLETQHKHNLEIFEKQGGTNPRDAKETAQSYDNPDHNNRLVYHCRIHPKSIVHYCRN